MIELLNHAQRYASDQVKAEHVDAVGVNEGTKDVDQLDEESSRVKGGETINIWRSNKGRIVGR